MIILSDSNNKIVGCYIDGTIITTITDQTLPTPEAESGKDSVLVINPTTKKLSYIYVDRPLTEDEKQDQSEQEQAQMLLALVLGGLM